MPLESASSYIGHQAAASSFEYKVANRTLPISRLRRYLVPAMHVANAPLVWPFSCILNGCRRSTVQRKRDSSRSSGRLAAPETKAPAPLHPTRERCLSSSSLDDRDLILSQGTKHTKMDQSQSMFMSRLPLEVRTMIYEEVLCRPVGVVHITTRKDGRLGYSRCKAENGRCRGLECFHGPNEDLYSTWRTRDKDLFSTWSPSNTPDIADGGMVALLQNCRQVSVSPNLGQIHLVLY